MSNVLIMNVQLDAAQRQTAPEIHHMPTVPLMAQCPMFLSTVQPHTKPSRSTASQPPYRR